LVPPFLGFSLIFFGLVLMVKSITLFATIGKGTLAPWDPTQKLVVHGVYRHLRNPMISGVFCLLLGETILFGSIPLFYWFALFCLVNLVYIPLFEEPALTRRFGEDYKLYQRNVPRWIPRLKPWDVTLGKTKR
jgi:protein-S-isoprenylcysteine O-methyltransferase Ste14